MAIKSEYWFGNNIIGYTHKEANLE